MPHRPKWFRDHHVLVSFAATSGINKDGDDLFRIDEETGRRTTEIDDELRDDVSAVLSGRVTGSIRWVNSEALTGRLLAVPVYFDDRYSREFERVVAQDFPGWRSATIGELVDSGDIEVAGGHGSPSADLRRGTIPYIKVSDLRAGQVNINPSNRVTEVVARRYWRGGSSNLRAFDLLSPARTSKNIGEFSVLMPGQEKVVLTKEIMVLRASDESDLDAFYLLWAMTMKIVRNQWRRIVFMQTNREDVGSRYREIRIPIPPSKVVALEISADFRRYYEGSAKLREGFLRYLEGDDKHHVFLSSAASLPEEDTESDFLSDEGDD